jgi:hypothetical protein
METEGSLPCSQEPSSGSCPKPEIRITRDYQNSVSSWIKFCKHGNVVQTWSFLGQLHELWWYQCLRPARGSWILTDGCDLSFVMQPGRLRVVGMFTASFLCDVIGQNKEALLPTKHWPRLVNHNCNSMVRLILIRPGGESSSCYFALHVSASLAIIKCASLV